MSGYIKREYARDAIRKAMTRLEKERMTPSQVCYMIADEIAYIPSADVVEVVRCKDCKHHIYEEPNMVYCPYATASWVSDNWFCADGERRSE